jgi:DNA-binding transcriptional ArsR family regulator
MRDQIKVFKALSSESRLRILLLLREHPHCVNAITSRLGLTQAAVSQHLRVLREAGLVLGEKRGYWVHYRIDLEALERHGQAMAKLLGTGTRSKPAPRGKPGPRKCTAAARGGCGRRS